MFNDWFGSTLGPVDYSCTDGVNISGAGSGVRALGNKYSTTGNESISLTFLNNTGSGCQEVHTWRNNQQSWLTNIATNHNSVDPANGKVISANIYGDSRDELVFVKFSNNGSSQIEIHAWQETYQHWLVNTATNHGEVDASTADVIAADTNGDGTDELVLVKYSATGSGKIETHIWNPGQQSWLTNIATNHGIVVN